MCGDSAPKSPSAGTCPKDPVTGAVMPCPACWNEDYEKEVYVANPAGRYSEDYDSSGANRRNYYGERKYKLYVPLKTGGDITVEIRFKAVNVSGTAVTATDISNAKTAMETGISSNWNGKFALEIDDPDCGKKQFPIKFKVKWVETGEHCTMNIHDTYAREGVTGLVMDVSKTTNAWTFAHEFGHSVGLPDEYGYVEGDNGTVKYYKPDGTLDAAISAPFDGKILTDADATIMSANGCLTVLKRHGWLVAIEVKALLKTKLGREVKCDVI